jgi:hypothetical protein
MAKEDVGPRPEVVPKKRRQIEELPDLWIAEWLAGDDIAPGERKKLTAEKERRKTLRPDVVLGVVCCDENATPEQLRTLREVLARIAPTEVHQHPLPGKVNHLVRSLGVPVTVHSRAGMRNELLRYEVVRKATVLVAIQKETTVQPLAAVTGVPAAIGLAKHRSMPVRIILPNGTEVT